MSNQQESRRGESWEAHHATTKPVAVVWLVKDISFKAPSVTVVSGSTESTTTRTATATSVSTGGAKIADEQSGDAKTLGKGDSAMGEMYFRFCEACNCYEYDCHGTSWRKDCIKGEPDYKPAHQKARERKSLELGPVERGFFGFDG